MNQRERRHETHASDDEMSKNHFRTIKMEEIHQFGSLALFESVIVDTFRLVVEFDLDREYLDSLCAFREISLMVFP